MSKSNYFVGSLCSKYIFTT